MVVMAVAMVAGAVDMVGADVAAGVAAIIGAETGVVEEDGVVINLIITVVATILTITTIHTIVTVIPGNEYVKRKSGMCRSFSIDKMYL